MLCVLSIGGVLKTYAKNILTFSTVEGAQVLASKSEIIIREAYRRLGIQIKVIPLQAEQALDMSNSGVYDGELFRVANIHKQYPNLRMVPAVILYNEDVVFAKNSLTFVVDGYESLRPYRIGIVKGVKNAEIGTAGMNREVVTTYKNLFLLLKAGRIDVAFCTREKGIKFIKELNIKHINMLEPPLSREKLYHYLHKRHEHLLPKVTKVLKQVVSELCAPSATTCTWLINPL